MEEKSEEEKRAAFIKAIEEVQKEHGYVIVADGRLEQLEGHVYRVVPTLNVLKGAK